MGMGMGMVEVGHFEKGREESDPRMMNSLKGGWMWVSIYNGDDDNDIVNRIRLQKVNSKPPTPHVHVQQVF